MARKRALLKHVTVFLDRHGKERHRFRRIWLWLVPSIDGASTRIRKFSHAPFPEGVEYVPANLTSKGE